MPRHTVQNSSLSRLSMVVAHRRFRAKWAWGRGPCHDPPGRSGDCCSVVTFQSRAVEYHCLSVGVRANINFYFFYPAPMQKGRRKRKLNMISLLKIDLWLVRTVLAAFAAFFFLNLGTSFFSSPYRRRLIGLHWVFLLFNCLFLWFFLKKHLLVELKSFRKSFDRNSLR